MLMSEEQMARELGASYMEEGKESEAFAQRLVKRNFWFSGLVRFLMAALIVILVWEIIRQNLDAAIQSHFPWRIHILETSASASLLGVFTALWLAREQFARTVRPALGWAGYTPEGAAAGRDLITVTSQIPKWLVFVYNGGQGRCIVKKADYRYSVFPNVDPGSAPERQDKWLPWREVIRDLGHLGVKLDTHYYLQTIGVGTSLSNTPSTGERGPFAAFDGKTLALLQNLDVRLTVIDMAGDEYERVLRLLHIAPSPYPRSDVSEDEPVTTTHGRKIEPSPAVA